LRLRVNKGLFKHCFLLRFTLAVVYSRGSVDTA
jgi:hypothetical protein